MMWKYEKCFFMYMNAKGQQILVNPIYKQFMTIDELKYHFIGLSNIYNYYKFEYLPDGIIPN